MEYLVELSGRALRDLAGIYVEINAENSDAARQWYLGLREAILSLEQHPNRCPFIQSNVAIRCLFYGHKPHVYRVLYRVLENQQRVEIVHVRHGARLGDL